MNGPLRYEAVQSVWKCQIQLQLISYHFDENLFVKNKVALLRGFTNRLHNNTIENVKPHIYKVTQLLYSKGRYTL